MNVTLNTYSYKPVFKASFSKDKDTQEILKANFEPEQLFLAKSLLENQKSNDIIALELKKNPNRTYSSDYVDMFVTNKNKENSEKVDRYSLLGLVEALNNLKYTNNKKLCASEMDSMSLYEDACMKFYEALNLIPKVNKYSELCAQRNMLNSEIKELEESILAAKMEYLKNIKL